MSKPPTDVRALFILRNKERPMTRKYEPPVETDPLGDVLIGTRNAFIAHGDCLTRLKELPDSSIDAVVTDPPAGIAFMGKSWDRMQKEGMTELQAFQDFIFEVFTEVYRVLKPGGHAVVWALPRTAHHTTMGVERAGFEIRDVVHHLFGTGFPKSLDVSKANADWQGWGTALKPAAENWILARKPLIGTVAANVLEHGTGALNIDGTRIGTHDKMSFSKAAPYTQADGSQGLTWNKTSTKGMDREQAPGGRWPANFVLSHSDGCVQTGKEEAEAWDCVPECAVRMLDEQSGQVGNGWKRNYGEEDYKGKQYKGGTFGGGAYKGGTTYVDSGGASRFFYVAKAPPAEKVAVLQCGCTPNLKIKDIPVISIKEAKAQAGQPCPVCGEKQQLHAHPTVKSVSLMEWLVKLVTPPEGVVLDPFTGSGTTGVAARKLGFRFIGMEQDKVYCALARHRIKNAVSEASE